MAFLAPKHKQNAMSSLCQSDLQAPSRNRTIGDDIQNVEAVERMPETWTLVEVCERGGDSKPTPIGREDRDGGGGDFRALAGSWYLLSPNLRVLPCGSPVPRGVDLERRIVKGEYLFLAF